MKYTAFWDEKRGRWIPCTRNDQTDTVTYDGQNWPIIAKKFVVNGYTTYVGVSIRGRDYPLTFMKMEGKNFDRKEE